MMGSKDWTKKRKAKKGEAQDEDEARDKEQGLNEA